MSNFLTRMGESSRIRAERAERQRPAELLAQRVRRLPPPPALRLSPQGFDLIAELKRRSPSEGTLASTALKISAQARDYARSGAAALSVLTEPDEFAGSLAHLKEAAAAAANAVGDLPVPTMRKDFLVSPYQLLEARAAGASGVLLIAAMLNDRELPAMVLATHQLGMFALVEVFDRADLQRATAVVRAAGPAVVEGRCRTLLGVNCRDLRTLAVDFGRFAALAPGMSGAVVDGIANDIPMVAESGVETPGQAARVAGLGYRLALVGTALMRSSDPGRLGTELLAAGRASAFEARGFSKPA
ncbi:MAG: indole-3-glycerol phosphate synthase TrpC [Gammaproteobacteria bacterium]